MTLDTNMLIAYYCVLAAAYNVVLQVFDLHTTSDVLKRKTGIEANPVLGWFLNSAALTQAKFWFLAAVKLVAAAACAMIGITGWFVSEYAVAAAVILTLLGVFYTKVVVSNWKIYKEEKQ